MTNASRKGETPAGRRIGAFALGVVVVAIGSGGVAAAWEGARVRRIEPPARPASERNIQVPIANYDPVVPQVDRDGRVWVSEKGGTIRVLLPYAGEIASWRIPAGIEAGTLEDRGGTRLALSRDGELFRLDPAQPGTMETVATGLPGAVGTGCRLGEQAFWTDAIGGVVVTDRDGNVLQRVANVLFARKRYRGGGVVLCGQGRAIAVVAGGKVARFGRSGLINAETPGALEGVSLAPHAAFVSDGEIDALLCTRERGCGTVDDQGNVSWWTEAGSHDGPARLDEQRFAILLNDGRLAVLSADGRVEKEVVVGNGAFRFLRGPDGVTAARTGGALWFLSGTGHLYRASGLLSDDPDEAPRVDRVLSVPSRFGGGGLVLSNGTGLLRTNYGSLYVLELR